jgi:hypothetical protein
MAAADWRESARYWRMVWAAKPAQRRAVAGATHFKGRGRRGAIGVIPIRAVVEKARVEVVEVCWVGSIVAVAKGGRDERI